MTNRLQHETSPYLLQHKENPVAWYAWGEEAFEQAKAEDKPILLSIGYSACHWCHVMAHESFEHLPTAQLMNALFINVKVDREERPDVDDIYMQALMSMRQSGGWPLTMFLLPDGRPFYGGTYYPREPRYGMPSFRQVLEAVRDAFDNRREELEQQASQLTEALDRTMLALGNDDEGFVPDLLTLSAQGIQSAYDKMNGGTRGAPKFPQPMIWEYLLRYSEHANDLEVREMVKTTLYKMANGGIYDQLGGGFHRYSVDAVWLVPHFEKMLYDNAQLSRLYLHAYQATQDPFFKQIAVEAYDYILREMTAPEGGFYSATDADSEGHEGKFFVWTEEEIKEALAPLESPELVDVAIEYYGITRGGNFEGTNILNVQSDSPIVAKRLGMTHEAFLSALAQVKDRLYAMRTNRVAPGLDDKIVTAWNGMMLASLAEGARALGRSDYASSAERAGDFFLETMMQPDGRLYRTAKGTNARLNGYLEDYANLIDAFLELYQTTFLSKWYVNAVKLAEFVLAHFVAEDGAGFFDTSDDHEKLIVRPRSLQDNAVPSGNAMMAKQLLRLFALSGDERYQTHARNALRPLIPAMQQYPTAFGEALNATDLLIRGVAEVALVGNPTHATMKEMLERLRSPYLPNLVVALSREAVIDSSKQVVPLLHNRTMREGLPTAYVCRQFVCQTPVTSAQGIDVTLRV